MYIFISICFFLQIYFIRRRAGIAEKKKKKKFRDGPGQFFSPYPYSLIVYCFDVALATRTK